VFGFADGGGFRNPSARDVFTSDESAPRIPFGVTRITMPEVAAVLRKSLLFMPGRICPGYK
jgi:hypothetical protein